MFIFQYHRLQSLSTLLRLLLAVRIPLLGSATFVHWLRGGNVFNEVLCAFTVRHLVRKDFYCSFMSVSGLSSFSYGTCWLSQICAEFLSRSCWWKTSEAFSGSISLWGRACRTCSVGIIWGYDTWKKWTVLRTVFYEKCKEVPVGANIKSKISAS